MSAMVAHNFPLVQLLSDVSCPMWGRLIDGDTASGSYLLRSLMELSPGLSFLVDKAGHGGSWILGGQRRRSGRSEPMSTPVAT